MDNAKVIDKLNEAIGLELGALLQYNQYALVLLGQERVVWGPFFDEASNEALSHARKFAAKVVALGGTPCCEPIPVKQTNDLVQMLENSLEVERRAVAVYTETFGLCQGNVAYCNMLEDQIDLETDDVEELEKILRKIKPVASQQSARQAG